MKKKSVVMILLILAAIHRSSGQTIIQTIDFLNKADTLERKPLQFKEKYRVKIININRNIFKIEDSFNEKAFNAAVPAAFSGIKLPASILTTVSAVDINSVLGEFDKSNKDIQEHKLDTRA